LPEVGGDYEHLVRTVCRLDGGFEPKFLPVGNSFDSLISMAAAGRGVVLCAEITLRDRPSTINFHLLKESKNQFELYLIRKKDFKPTAMVNSFVRILFQAARRLSNSDTR
jgi:DNA-binding transcriptional LysR family regulator